MPNTPTSQITDAVTQTNVKVLGDAPAISIATVTNNGSDASVFSSREVVLQGDSVRLLSDQIPAVNFRLRASDQSYSSDFHVAGDPTLLVILSGVVRIELRTGQTRDFTCGEMFIAEDYLAQGVTFDNAVHGHRAEVVADKMAEGEVLQVLHLKLEKR